MDNTPIYESEHEELKRHRREFVDARFEQLSGLELSSADAVYSYLLHVNAGATIGILTFMGTNKDVAKAAWSHLSLGCFVLGVIFCGIYRARHIHWTTRLFREWRKNYGQYADGKILWEELTRKDEDEAKEPRSLWIFGYGSGLLFVAGCLFGLGIVDILRTQ